MAMQSLICPHCGKENGKRAINEKIRMSVNHKICTFCNKPFSWYGEFGKLIIIKASLA